MKSYFEFTKSGKACEFSYHRSIKKAIVVFDQIQGFKLLGDDECDDDYKTQNIFTLEILTKSTEFFVYNVDMDEYERFEQAFKDWLDEGEFEAFKNTFPNL